MFKDEKIYIAGPECFYTNGYTMLAAMRKTAESVGFGVTLPNDNPLDLENPNLQLRADSIMKDLETVMNETTIIIADLEAYRGSEADGGSVYEIGMAYAKGIRCYGYTRDKRPLACKDQQYKLVKGKVVDEKNNAAPYHSLPFSPCVVGSTKIIQGDFNDCLRIVATDIEEEYKTTGCAKVFNAIEKSADGAQSNMPTAYLACCERYNENFENYFEKIQAIFKNNGIILVTQEMPFEFSQKCTTLDMYAKAAKYTKNVAQNIANCDAVIADLNFYKGYECSNDVSFECGVGFQLGKKLVGYMADARPTIDKIPHYGTEFENRDFTGSNVEDFNYAANLMFGSTMPILEGQLEELIGKISKIILAN